VTRLLAALQHHTGLDAALLIDTIGATLTALSLAWRRQP
jgi:hypothetical protein